MCGDVSRHIETYQDIPIIFRDISTKNVDVEMCGDVSRRIETYQSFFETPAPVEGGAAGTPPHQSRAEQPARPRTR